MSTKRKVFLVLTAVVLLFVAGLGFLVSRIDMGAATERLETRLSEVLGLEVEVRGGADLDLFPLRISFSDLIAREGEAEALRAKKMTVRVALLPLLGRQVRISSLVLEEPVLALQRDRSGRLNLRLSSKREHEEKEESRLLVGRVSVKDGSINFTDEGSGAQVELAGLALELDDLRREAKGNLSFTGELGVDRLRINKIEVKGLKTKLNTGEGEWRAEPFRAELFRTKVKGSLGVELGGAHPIWRVDLAAEDLQLGDLFQTLAEKKLFEGKVDVQVDLAASSSGGGLLANLEGSFKMHGNNLVQHGFDLDGVLREFRESKGVDMVDIGLNIGAYAFAGPVGALVSQEFDTAGLVWKLQQDKNQPIDKIVFDWRIENGQARVMDVALRTDENRLAFQGAIDLARRRYDGFTLGVLDSRGCAVVTEKIVGPLTDPTVQMTGMLSTLAGPLTEILQKTWDIINPDDCHPFYQGSVAPPEAASRNRFPSFPSRDGSPANLPAKTWAGCNN